jgi:transcriptional regulator with XRE-family HTH domain
LLDLLPANAVCARLGARLRTQRLARNFTQAELAERAGCSLSALRRLESGGQGTLELVVRVAQALSLAEALQLLFELPALNSIAQAEAQVLTPLRQRARRRKVAP